MSAMELPDKEFVINIGNFVFFILCSYSFLIGLVIALEIPLKFALIVGCTPLGILLILSLLVFACFKWDFTIWRKHYREVSENETITRIFKVMLLPCLLTLLYFYIRGDDGENILYSTSPVRSEMIIHPCGSSYKQKENDVWDAADLISQTSETEIFVITNAVFGVNQTKGNCPQTGAYCSTLDINPGKTRPGWMANVSWTFAHDFSRAAIWNPVSCPKESEECESGVLYDNGIQTNECHLSRLCSIDGWCPPIVLGKFSPQPMFNVGNFSIFLDMRPNFYDFSGVSWTNGGAGGGYSANYAEMYSRYYSYSKSIEKCIYHETEDPFCPRFLLENIVTSAGENFTEIATYGGQFKVEVEWNCKFDWGKDIFDCLPKFKFLNRSNNKGKPKIHSQITRHDIDNLNRRTVTYSLGINISVDHVGKGLQIRFLNSLLYAQFIYVSYAMIKGPILWMLRCFYASYLTLTVTKDGDSKL